MTSSQSEKLYTYRCKISRLLICQLCIWNNNDIHLLTWETCQKENLWETISHLRRQLNQFSLPYSLTDLHCSLQWEVASDQCDIATQPCDYQDNHRFVFASWEHRYPEDGRKVEEKREGVRKRFREEGRKGRGEREGWMKGRVTKKGEKEWWKFGLLH